MSEPTNIISLDSGDFGKVDLALQNGVEVRGKSLYLAEDPLESDGSFIAALMPIAIDMEEFLDLIECPEGVQEVVARLKGKEVRIVGGKHNTSLSYPPGATADVFNGVIQGSQLFESYR